MNENKNQGYKKSYCNYVAFIEMVTMARINQGKVLVLSN
jgi:hypothetical protein